MNAGISRASIGRRRRPWSEEDDAELVRLVSARKRPGEIAEKLQRTLDAVRGRAAQLGLALPSTLRPWRAPVLRNAPRPAPREAAPIAEPDED